MKVAVKHQTSTHPLFLSPPSIYLSIYLSIHISIYLSISLICDLSFGYLNVLPFPDPWSYLMHYIQVREIIYLDRQTDRQTDKQRICVDSSQDFE